MSNLVIAIDPGNKGGVASGVAGVPPRLDKLPPEGAELVALLRDIVSSSKEYDGGEVSLVLEQVGGYAGTGHPGSSMFRFGQSYGTVLGVAAAMGMNAELVTPQVWQRRLNIGVRGLRTKSQWKSLLRKHAISLYPTLKPTLQTADALLLWHAKTTWTP
jgi:hypothetical protein